MTTARLTPTSERYAQAAGGQALVASEPRRVEAIEMVGERKRSLREELNEAEGGIDEITREEARRLAAQLAELSPEAQALLTQPLPPNGFCVVDEQA
ncbi:MAG: hypothetical protein FWC58_01125 [Desulfobulbus sp.]|nr:hypothetical protein [Desulfobulbus sp.]